MNNQNDSNTPLASHSKKDEQSTVVEGNKVHDINSKDEKKHQIGWLGSFYQRFEGSVVTIYILNYVTVGMIVFYQLMVKDLLKTDLGVGPDELQIVTSLLMVPWSIKLVYGLLSDNFPINGYKRKSYLILNGFVGFFGLIMLFPRFFTNITTVTIFLVITMTAAASTDVLSDCLMVIECRKDQERGSEDFQTLGFGTYSLFGIVGAIGGAFITQYWKPRWGFLLYSFLFLFVSLIAFRVVERKEKLDQGSCHHMNSQLKKMYSAFKTPIIYKVCLYQFLSGALIPRFQEYKYYFLLEVIGISEFSYGMLFIGSCLFMLLTVFLFHWVFTKFSYRQGMSLAVLITSVTTIFDILFVLRVNVMIGINDYVFLALTNMLEDFLGFRYSIVANGVINTRITPHSVEGTVLSVLTGMSNLGFGVIAPLVGNAWAYYLGIDKHNLQNLWMGLVAKFFMSFVPLLFIKLLPNKEEIQEDEGLKVLNKQLEDEKEDLLDDKEKQNAT